MTKPILFHDIDGVLFGHYGPSDSMQVRPGVGDWLIWVHEHFEVVWLTTWREPGIKALLTMFWPRASVYMKLHNPKEVRVAQWHDFKSKAEWVSKEIAGRDVEWFWVDDQIPDPEQLCGLDLRRCLMVSSNGDAALLTLRETLELSEATVKNFHQKM